MMGNREKPQHSQTLRDGRLYLLGEDGNGPPHIVIDEYALETRVWLAGSVWGLRNTDKTFLGAPSKAARRYAETLMADLIKRAEARRKYKEERKLKNKAARILYGIQAKPWGRQ